MKKAMIVLAAVLLGACGGTAPPQNGAPPGAVAAPNVTRYVDNETGVACWVYQNYDKGGISCLPLSQTKLDK